LPVGNILQDAERFVVMVFGPKPIIACIGNPVAR
jgi:hypothetical protein